jgi:phosphoglycolate phosphatase
MVLGLCARLGVPPGRTVMVGDSAADLAMGRAAGVARCYGVLTGTGSREDLAPLADEVLESVGDLIDR